MEKTTWTKVRLKRGSRENIKNPHQIQTEQNRWVQNYCKLKVDLYQQGLSADPYGVENIAAPKTQKPTRMTVIGHYTREICHVRQASRKLQDEQHEKRRKDAAKSSIFEMNSFKYS